ncbi:MAG: CoA transferase [Planctomycetes bacterium]|nr:CoA transferase [Planctomycetota bacterium]
MGDQKTQGRHPRPLAGVRVLDLTRVLAGPYCTMVLADLGAEVVKIERPGGGDDARHFGPFLPSGVSAYFAGINRGKKSVALDLKDERDRETFLRLVEKADVLVENFRPGTLARLGLPVEELHRRNPRLVYAALSGFGHAGTETDRPAYDIIVQALSGLMSITGDRAGHYVKVGASVSDILTGLYGAIAVAAALFHRDRTGRGTTIDLAMLDCTVSVLENALSRFSLTGVPPEPLGTRHPSITPFQAFEAADGPLVIAAGNDALWRRLCEVLGRPELAADERLATNGLRTEHREYLEATLEPLLAAEPRDVWLAKLSRAGVPAAAIRDLGEVVADEHLRSRDILHEMHGGEGEVFITAGSPLRMNAASPELSSHAPELGEHTQAVLAEWLESAGS